VIRGNLLVIPIENSFLYVEPVYLIAEEVNIPQLIRVIAAYSNRVVMQPTLDEAIKAVFSGLPTVAAGPPGTPPVPSVQTRPSEDALARVRKQFHQAEEALKRGQWSEFGRAMDDVSKLLGK
jgi:uncharacterized membrane protein (UPF0182 family)